MTESKTMEKIRCDACPVMCYIADGKAGACDRYANHGGDLIRLDPLTIIQTGDQKLVPFLGDQGDQDTWNCLLYTSPSPRDVEESRMPSSA